MSRFILCLFTAALLSFSSLAYATFAGKNGKIVFQHGSYPNVSRVATINADGTQEAVLTDGPHDFVPRWSPDGLKIVYQGPPGWHIYTMNADGTDQTQLTFEGFNGWPSFSSDGSQVIYIRNQDLYKVNPDGSGGKTLFIALSQMIFDSCSNSGNFQVTRRQPEAPAWSNDGTKIAFDVACQWIDTVSGNEGLFL